MVIVSLVNKADIAQIEPLCKRAFDQMGYAESRGYVYSDDHIKKVIAKGVDSPNHILTKYVKDGCILGFMAVGVTDFSFYAVGSRTASEIVWHGDPFLTPRQQLTVQMALLDDMMARTDAVGANLELSLDVKFIGIERLLVRKGFTGKNKTYIRRRPWAI